MDKEVINELIEFLKGKVVENYVEAAWKEIPMYSGFTGYVANTVKNEDEEPNEFKQKRIELKNKKYNEAIRYLEALSDFTKGE